MTCLLSVTQTRLVDGNRSSSGSHETVKLYIPPTGHLTPAQNTQLQQKHPFTPSNTNPYWVYLPELAVNYPNNQQDQHGNNGDRDYPVGSHPHTRVSTN